MIDAESSSFTKTSSFLEEQNWCICGFVEKLFVWKEKLHIVLT